MPFTKPPIIELVIGVQFATQYPVDSSRLVLFWSEKLLGTYPKASEAPHLEDEFEHFGKANHPRGGGFLQKWESLPRIRFLFDNEEKDRRIQLQDSRLILNWMRRDADYPRFSVLFREFAEQFESWQRFSKANGIGEVVPNQWELSYINWIPQGEFWQTPGDWHRISELLFLAKVDTFAPLALEDRTVQWRLRMPNDTGRITLTAGQIVGNDNRLGLQLSITARGPASDTDQVHQRLQLAHDQIIELFERLTSDEAKAHWGVT